MKNRIWHASVTFATHAWGRSSVTKGFVKDEVALMKIIFCSKNRGSELRCSRKRCSASVHTLSKKLNLSATHILKSPVLMDWIESTIAADESNWNIESVTSISWTRLAESSTPKHHPTEDALVFRIKPDQTLENVPKEKHQILRSTSYILYRQANHYWRGMPAGKLMINFESCEQANDWLKSDLEAIRPQSRLAKQTRTYCCSTKTTRLDISRYFWTSLCFSKINHERRQMLFY